MLFSNKITNIDFIETLSHLDCCVFIKDINGAYTFINNTVCQVFGLTHEAIIGKSDDSFFDLTLSQEIKKNDSLVLQGIAITDVEKNIFNDGSIKYYQSTKSPVYSTHGEIIGIIGMSIDITNSIQKHHETEYSAQHDVITGLYNRRFLENQLTSEISLHHRKKQPLSFIMLDIDNFKQINDQYGHDMGDHALTVVSNLIVETVREEDICCRFGGDEFAILLPLTAPREAFFLAERIRKSVCEHTFIDSKNQPMPVTITLGVTCLSSGMHATALKKCADDALLNAKKQRKNSTLINCQLKSSITSCYNQECATRTNNSSDLPFNAL